MFTTAGLTTVSISVIVMWWRRRTIGTLGAPIAQEPARFAVGFFAIVAPLGIPLPLLGLSMIGMWLIERVVPRRIPSVRDFRGQPVASEGR